MIKLGLLYVGNYIRYEGIIYKICGISRHRNYNNILCITSTNKRKWFDVNTNVEEVKDNEL